MVCYFFSFLISFSFYLFKIFTAQIIQQLHDACQWEPCIKCTGVFPTSFWGGLILTFGVNWPHVGPGQSPLSLHFPSTSPSTHCLLVSFTFPFFLYYTLLHLFSCFSIHSHSTRIVPLRFQAGYCRKQLNLALLFCVLILCNMYF